MTLTAGGDSRFVPAPTIVSHEDLDRRNVTLRGPNGTQTITRPPALSLSGLLVLGGIDPGTIDHVDVTRPDGTAVVLSRADMAGGAEGPPAVWLDDQSTHFLRTVVSDGDINATDNIATITGQPLAVGVRTGPVLNVSATASPTAVKRGDAVTLTATVAGVDPDTLTFTWRFGDGESATGATVTHAYATAGRYLPSVAVVGSDDSSGAAQAPAVTVSEATAPPPAAGTGDDPTAGGDTPGAGDANANEGAATGQKHKPKHPGSTPSSGAGSGSTNSGSVAPSAPATSSSPAPAPASAPSTPTPSSESTTKHHQTKRKPAPDKTPAQPVDPGDDGEVKGVLLAGVDDAAIRSGLAAIARPQAVTARQGLGTGTDRRWLILVGVVVALVAAGAIRETRRR